MLPDPGRWGKTRKENRNARFVRFDLCIIFVANHQLHGTEAIHTHTHTHIKIPIRLGRLDELWSQFLAFTACLMIQRM